MDEHNHEAAFDRSLITLAHMPQQANVWAPDDDWTGVVDRKERRKLQNRQNQRKWRQRKKAIRGTSTSTSPTATDSGSSIGNSTDVIEIRKGERQLSCGMAPRNANAYKRWFEATAHHHYLANSPQIEHLISLTRLNVHYAINQNIRAVGMDIEWTCADDLISIFNMASPHHASYNEELIPLALRPTDIQRRMLHHPWLDFFPFPKMRDWLILGEHLYDDEELCHDLMAFWDTRATQATLVVWGQSWDPRSWEVTEGFAVKWGWLLRGSPELLASTNYWRRRRGEAPLRWRSLLAEAPLPEALGS
ncbi:bZIP transcription factor [Aspergillus undulatus]|uniref:bZIP transcription factor n=1 Tax=Aspergillus undulatus TaxID=1810928 RepID=UPI003CCD958C